jgi:hypothetical protein
VSGTAYHFARWENAFNVGADSQDALNVERSIPSLSLSLTQEVGRTRRKQSFASGMQEVQTEVSEVVS